MVPIPSSTSARVYGALLRVLPAEIRARYGSEMVAMFEDAWKDAGVGGRPRLVARALLDLIINAVVLRVSTLRGRRSGGEGPGAPMRPPRRGAAERVAECTREVAVAARSLARRPAFTGLVLLTLTAGIGVNASIFGFVNGLLLRPLPYAEPDRLVQLSETAPGLGTMDLSLPDFDLWRAETRVFDGIFAFDDSGFLLAGGGGSDLPRPVQGAVVSPGFLDVLGVSPALGRGFAKGEAAPGADGVVIVSDRLWASRFSRRADVLGTTIELNGRARTVVGVAPPGFHFPEVADLWVPLPSQPGADDPEDYGYDAIGRLGDGMDIADARRDGERVAALLAAASPATKSGLGVAVYPLRYADVPGGLAGAAVAVVLLAAVCLVLLVACSNVAHMLLARAEDRSREMVVRRALGADKRALMRHPLVESALLAVVGAAGALLVAAWSGRLLSRLLPEERPFWLSFGVDGRVLIWTLVVAVLVALATAVAPALHAARAGMPPGSGGRVTRPVRRRLIGAQVALASFLVVGAGATTRALQDFRRADPGLDPRDVVVIDVVLAPWDYPDAATRRAAARAILAVVGTVPEVVEASAVETVPFVGSPIEVALDVGFASTVRAPVGVLNAFAGRYLEAVRLPLLRGRTPTLAEEAAAAPVALVSESLAARLWPGADPLGRRIRHGTPGARSPTVPEGQAWLEVVGVVADVRQEGPGRPIRGQLYVPLSRLAPVALSLVLRSRGGDPATVVSAVRARTASVASEVAFYEATTLEAALGFSLWTERLASRLLAGFGALALFLALVGVYGMVAYSVRRREHELRVRVALGATGATIRSSVLVDTLRMVAPGLVAGLLTGGAVVAASGSALGWLHPLDLRTLLGTAALFLVVGVAASHPSASRAARLDPGRALRVD